MAMQLQNIHRKNNVVPITTIAELIYNSHQNFICDNTRFVYNYY